MSLVSPLQMHLLPSTCMGLKKLYLNKIIVKITRNHKSVSYLYSDLILYHLKVHLKNIIGNSIFSLLNNVNWLLYL